MAYSPQPRAIHSIVSGGVLVAFTSTSQNGHSTTWLVEQGAFPIFAATKTPGVSRAVGRRYTACIWAKARSVIKQDTPTAVEIKNPLRSLTTGRRNGTDKR